MWQPSPSGNKIGHQIIRLAETQIRASVFLRFDPEWAQNLWGTKGSPCSGWREMTALDLVL